jgi:hypothetical protein
MYTNGWTYLTVWNGPRKEVPLFNQHGDWIVTFFGPHSHDVHGDADKYVKAHWNDK